jgi:serine protease inhibitor
MIRNTSKIIAAILLAASFIMTSCQKEKPEILANDPVPIELSSDQVELIGSGNSFAFDIFRIIAGNETGKVNLMISPLSISYALSMTLNGANGPTRDAMLEALRVNGITPAKINQSYKDLTEALLSVDKRVLISIANSVWTEKNFVVKKPFIDILTGYYNTESKSFDITNPLAYQAVNGWIEGKTNGLIKDMLDKLDPNAVMLLVNAIYFKGKWQSQFDKAKTVKMPFYKPDGSKSDVPMMKQTFDYKIYDGDGFVLAELPYGQGNFVMDILLPDKVLGGTNAFLPSLTGQNFESWLGNLHERETDISFPLFKYGYKKKLKDILSDMGMGLAFSDFADFSNISDLKLKINEVTHQAFIETNEEGTEAAAATVVEIITTSMPMIYTLNIDHSFFYIIRETTTNTILFMGRVDDPL